MPLSSGTRLGPYEIASSIGAGGMGEVYRARDTRLNRDVAVKVLPRSLTEDQDRLRRFALEAQSASALNHPNILVIHDIGTHDGMPYMVSELLEGETLRQRLREGKLSITKAVDFARQTASGLAAAHAKSITHRDIKPENLFLTKDGHVKILDFGLAKLTQPEPPAADATPTIALTQPETTQPGMVMGTMGYMSPEQVRGRPADPRSDIFSFGAVLYEMVTGQRAFSRASAAETMSAILKEDPLEAEAGIAPPLERIIRHCLEKNPDERFQSARDIAFALDALSQTSTRAMPAVEEHPIESARPGIKWPRWALVCGVLVCALTGVLAFLAGARSQQRPPLVFRRLTFRRGEISAARFAPDGNTLVYSAAWEGEPTEIYSIRLDSPEYHPPVVPGASLLSVSAAGEMALLLHPRTISFQTTGTLARVSFSGGAPREVLEKVQWADWSPNGDLAIVRDGDNGNQLEFPVGKILFRTAGFISQPRFSPAGDRIGFIHHPRQNDDAGEVVVVDLAGQAKKLSRIWGSAWGLAWMPLTNEIWFTAAPGGSKRELLAVTLSGTLRTVLPETGNLTLEDISRNGRVLLHSLSQQMKLRFVGADGKTQRDLSWLDWSLVTGIANDGSGIVFFESGEGAGENLVSYYRKTDGSPAVKLGNLTRPRLSPDGKSALASDPRTSELAIVPIGPGETKRVPLAGFTVNNVEWLPNARGVVFVANEAGHGLRLYAMDLAGGKPRAIAPEGTLASPPVVSPDGKFVTVLSSSDQVMLYPLAGGDPVICPGIEAGERPYGWSVDGAKIYVMSRGTLPGKVYRVNWKTGQRELWKEVAPLDAAGVPDISAPQITADGRSYAYSYRQTLSQLHLVEGLR
jgi:serine/threonine protein kinase/Tol biopolymer transport system component